MAQALKEIYFTKAFFNRLSHYLKHSFKDFDESHFYSLAFDSNWEKRELKEKMHHTAVCLGAVLPENYKKALDILWSVAPHIRGFEGMALCEYVSKYGLNNPSLSLKALKFLTQFSSAEYAIRPFLINDLKSVMSFMMQCASDENEHVRRFASEGCRPRLPWAIGVPDLKKDPSLIFPILAKLMNDPSEYVRRSVANNLNDISKDHSETVLQFCTKWFGTSENVNKIIKHALRTLLKEGNPKALQLFGFGKIDDIEVLRFSIDQSKIKIGNDTRFSFELYLKSKKNLKIRLEYKVYYLKANGKHSSKVFQITENEYKPGKFEINRKLSFKDMTTRKHYPGIHYLSLVINGKEIKKLKFELTK